MSISYWQDLKNKPVLEFDFCVVGAGIAGVSCAYWLEKFYPQAKIALIEKNKLGSGASGRNAGFVTCGSAEHFARLAEQFGLAKATEIWKFSEQNRELLREEIWQLDPDSVQYRQSGSCTVAPSAGDWVRYQGLAETMAKQGIAVGLIQAAELKEAYGVKNFEGAIEYKHDGVVHPVLLLQKILSQLKRTQLFENEEAFRVSEQGLETDRHRFQAPKILFALNAYLPLLLPEWLPHIKPQRAQILMTQPLPAFVKGPCYLTKHLVYFRQLPTGELLLGGFRNADNESENTFVEQPTEKIQSAILDFAKSYFEFGPQIEVKYKWSGIMGFTEDRQMLIGAHPKLKNVHLMAGCSSHGMGLSFHAAKTLVASLQGQPVPAHLDINRLKEV